MDAKTSVEETSQMLRQQIRDTRAELGHKLETLEDEAREIAGHARDEVRYRLRSLQSLVGVKSYVQSHPARSCIAALAVGVVIGAARIPRRRSVRDEAFMRWYEPVREEGRMWRWMAPEIATLRSFAIGKAMALIGEALRRRGEGDEGRTGRS